MEIPEKIQHIPDARKNEEIEVGSNLRNTRTWKNEMYFFSKLKRGILFVKLHSIFNSGDRR